MEFVKEKLRNYERRVRYLERAEDYANKAANDTTVSGRYPYNIAMAQLYTAMANACRE